jgi:hypothetical protein
MDIMLDLETLSSAPDGAIIAIGACTFASEGTPLAEHERKTFNMIIDAHDAQTAARGSVDARTMQWWVRQSEAARSIFNSPFATPTAIALQQFSAFCADFDGPRIWGNGANFDNVLLRGAYDRMSLKAPWSFRDDRCYRTLKSLRPDIEFKPSGVAHNALDDAVSQARHAEAILAAMKREAP